MGILDNKKMVENTTNDKIKYEYSYTDKCIKYAKDDEKCVKCRCRCIEAAKEDKKKTFKEIRLEND